MDFAPLTRDNAPAWARLLAVSFGRTENEMGALLDWLHAGYPVIAWGAWDGDHLAAQYSCRLVDLHLPAQAQPAKVGMSINMAVHPDYRGQGLVKHLARPVYEQVAQCGGLAGVGFSNAEGVRVDLKSKSYGYRVVGKMVSSVVWLKRQQVEPLTLTDQWPDATVALTNRSLPSIYFASSVDGMRHRFACHPFRQYQFGVWEDAGVVCGLVIYRPVHMGFLRGAALLSVYGENIPLLLSRWAESLRLAGMHFVHIITSPRSHVRDSLKSVGLVADWPFTRTPHYLTARSLGECTPSEIFDFGRWDCIGGDVL